MLNKFTTDPLTADDEQTLARAWRDKKDVKARDRIIFSNLRFAMKVIASARRISERDDLEQECVVGMLEALKRYDPDRGYRFISYAVSYILVGIERAEIAARNIRLPPDAFHSVVGKGDRLSEASAIAACIAALPMVSLDDSGSPQTNTGEGGRFLVDYHGHGSAAHTRVADSEATAEPDETDAIANEVMSRATPLEKLVLTRRHFDDKTLDEVGAEIGVSRERVRQIEAKAAERLREGDSAAMPSNGSEFWREEADAIVSEFRDRAVKFATLRAWAGQRYEISARRYLFNLLAHCVLERRADWFGDTVRFGGRRAQKRANPRRTRNVAA